MRQVSDRLQTSPGVGFTERTICYMDLLGFSDAVVLKSKDGSKINELALLLRDAEKLVGTYEGAELTFQSLSDSIFISTTNESIDNIRSLITCCQDIFTFFLTRGFLARGGVASGWCLVSSSIVLGEPVVRAVKLEQQVAEFPRIVVGKSTIDLLRSEDSGNFIAENIVRGVDGPFWIDPFVPMFDFIRQTDLSWKNCEEVDRAKLQAERLKLIEEANLIARFISENLYSMQENKRVFSFHYWMYVKYRESANKLLSSVGSDLVVPDFSV